MKRAAWTTILAAVVMVSTRSAAAEDGRPAQVRTRTVEKLDLLAIDGVTAKEGEALRGEVVSAFAEIGLCFRAYYGERPGERRIWVVLTTSSRRRVSAVSFANPTSSRPVARPLALARCVAASLGNLASVGLPSMRKIVLSFRYVPPPHTREVFWSYRALTTAGRNAKFATAVFERLRDSVLPCLRRHVRRDFTQYRLLLVFATDERGKSADAHVIRRRGTVNDQKRLDLCIEQVLKSGQWEKGSARSTVKIPMIYVSGVRNARK